MKTTRLACALAIAGVLSGHSQVQAFETKDLVSRALGSTVGWAYPDDVVPAANNKTVVYVADNLRNSGILSVAEGVREATNEIGWKLQIIDAGGDPKARHDALAALRSSRPDGIVLGGFDATDHLDLLEELNASGTTIVGWHAAASPGPIPGTPVVENVTTDPIDVAQVAAAYAIEATNRQAGAVIFTDSRFGIAVAKSDEMARVINTCETCKLLEIVDLPLDQTRTSVPKEIARLSEKYGADWTVSLGINDLYFDDAIIELSFAEPDFAKSLINVSAGDGSVSAYQRIENQLFQSATVPEPLIFQGWQIVDELNRAFSGVAPSGFVAPTKLVAQENWFDDGGEDWRFEPDNGYRDIFRKIWER